MTTDKKIYISSAILILLIILFIIFLICPIFEEIKKNSKDLISQNENLVSLEVKVVNLKKFETIYQNLKPNLEKIDNLFIDPEVPVEFISFLEKTSRSCNLTLSLSLSSQKKIAEETWYSLNFQTNLTGSFLDFSKFLEKLEASPYLIEIKDITINKLKETEAKKESKKSSFSNIETTLLIKVYTKQENENKD